MGRNQTNSGSGEFYSGFCKDPIRTLVNLKNLIHPEVAVEALHRIMPHQMHRGELYMNTRDIQSKIMFSDHQLAIRPVPDQYRARNLVPDLNRHRAPTVTQDLDLYQDPDHAQKAGVAAKAMLNLKVAPTHQTWRSMIRLLNRNQEVKVNLDQGQSPDPNQDPRVHRNLDQGQDRVLSLRVLHRRNVR